MYLISLYFDAKADHMIHNYMSLIARQSENDFMIQNQVPAHLTLLSFDHIEENRAIELFNKVSFQTGRLEVMSFGVLPSRAIYLAPLYNDYLHNLLKDFYYAFSMEGSVHFSQYYRPDRFLPHITVGKTLKQNQMEKACNAMIYTFTPFELKVCKIELASNHPFRVLAQKKIPEL